jgi:hypothetical protein
MRAASSSYVEPSKNASRISERRRGSSCCRQRSRRARSVSASACSAGEAPGSATSSAISRLARAARPGVARSRSIALLRAIMASQVMALARAASNCAALRHTLVKTSCSTSSASERSLSTRRQMPNNLLEVSR